MSDAEDQKFLGQVSSKEIHGPRTDQWFYMFLSYTSWQISWRSIVCIFYQNWNLQQNKTISIVVAECRRQTVSVIWTLYDVVKIKHVLKKNPVLHASFRTYQEVIGWVNLTSIVRQLRGCTEKSLWYLEAKHVPDQLKSQDRTECSLLRTSPTALSHSTNVRLDGMCRLHSASKSKPWSPLQPKETCCRHLPKCNHSWHKAWYWHWYW